MFFKEKGSLNKYLNINMNKIKFVKLICLNKTLDGIILNIYKIYLRGSNALSIPFFRHKILFR